MKLELHGPLSPALQEHTVARLEAALGQHESHVELVIVRLSDLNGPKGGVDQRCQLTIKLHKQPEIIIDERGEDLYGVVAHAADRAKNAVGRALDKVRDKRAQKA